MIEEGELTPESAANHPLRNMLTRVLGTHQPLEKIDTGIVDAAPGDRFLLCSDGLHNMMSADSITATLKSQTDPKKTAARTMSPSLSFTFESTGIAHKNI
jgi:protein phosphatase